jgi:hypothetical protein
VQKRRILVDRSLEMRAPPSCQEHVVGREDWPRVSCASSRMVHIVSAWRSSWGHRCNCGLDLDCNI